MHRRNELHSLTPKHLDLDAKVPTVTVSPKDTKNQTATLQVGDDWVSNEDDQ